ncbi:hypothetical protein ABZ690_26410, partial [Streptomyces sp. NPDC006967]|uniref:hypothetical protein n=1 Tax=Streptomyces sp. NPDC006967 TaxID=3156906 RepID=UPI0033CCAC09
MRRAPFGGRRHTARPCATSGDRPGYGRPGRGRPSACPAGPGCRAATDTDGCGGGGSDGRPGRLHYFGISYGTELGGVYAHLFPEKVG